MLRRFLVERDIEGLGAISLDEMAALAEGSSAILASMVGIQWQHTYVAEHKSFSIYLAESEEYLRQHADVGGFPITRIVEIKTVVDASIPSHAVREAEMVQNQRARGRNK